MVSGDHHGNRRLMHGWIIIDKPLGLGSTQGVSAVKRALREGGYGKYKVGHGGTLDPLATGVLPIAVGEATKLAGRMLDSDKVYDFTVRFGVETDTLDLEGQVIAESDVRPSRAEVEAILPRFTGPIDQVPPAYSALKVDGERAYDLARKGEEVTLASRAVTIHALALREVTADSATLTAHVSKGTYIRSLARDIAHALGTVGHVTMLRRVKAGPFTLESAISLDKLAESAKGRTLEHCLLPLRAGLDDIPALTLEPGQAGALRQGKVLTGIATEDGQHFALEGDTPVALVEVSDGNVRVVRGFNL
jgi:tRNA pseudouridine55 synthase